MQRRMRPATRTVPANTLAIDKLTRCHVEKLKRWKVEGVHGLYVQLLPSGAASYVVKLAIGVGRTVTLGRAGRGGLPLADATSKAEGLTRQVEQGLDPVEVEAEKAARRTLRQLFEERTVKDGGTHPRTLADYKLALEKDIFPTLGDMLVFPT